MNYAHIDCTRREVLLGRFSVSYAWRGDDNALAAISYSHLKSMGYDTPPKRLTIGPFHLRLVSGDGSDWLCRHESIYARADGSRVFSWAVRRLRCVIYAIHNALRVRVVCSLMVWGLAYVPEDEYPSWRNIGRRRQQ